MKNTNEMSNEQLIKWANKTINSMSSESGYHASQSKKCTLVDRYDELKEEMKERGILIDFCFSRNTSEHADGWDFFA